MDRIWDQGPLERSKSHSWKTMTHSQAQLTANSRSLCPHLCSLRFTNSVRPSYIPKRESCERHNQICSKPAFPSAVLHKILIKEKFNSCGFPEKTSLIKTCMHTCFRKPWPPLAPAVRVIMVHQMRGINFTQMSKDIIFQAEPGN